MKLAHSLEEINKLITENSIALLYISRENCSVCHSLLPQIEQVLENYPTVARVQVDAEIIPEIAAQYTVFTVPAILVFANGKEMIRKARFVPIAEFDAEIANLVTHFPTSFHENDHWNEK